MIHVNWTEFLPLRVLSEEFARTQGKLVAVEKRRAKGWKFPCYSGCAPVAKMFSDFMFVFFGGGNRNELKN